MADSRVRIGLVLPDVMGTYGDGGNAVVLRQRLLLRGIRRRDRRDHAGRSGARLAGPLHTRRRGGLRAAIGHPALLKYPGLQRAADRGAPVLAICAAIQVLGHWYETSSGERVDGVGMLDVDDLAAGHTNHRRGGVQAAAAPV